jgi:pimeloyl-ACP methyl ester carboxylesterase
VSNAPVPPSILRLLGEVRALRHRVRFAAIGHLARRHDGGGRPVIVIPGFMVHDVISVRLRRTLAAASYDARGWGLGLNRGLRPDTVASLVALLERVHAESGRPVALVGWSLGGLFAREIAKIRPDLVERVVTLASPFSGDPRANNVWRIYERIAGHPVDDPPITVRLAEKPPVPTIALWTPLDGLVSPRSARGLPGERDVEVEVRCRHIDIISNPVAVAAVLDALALDVA